MPDRRIRMRKRSLGALALIGACAQIRHDGGIDLLRPVAAFAPAPSSCRGHNARITTRCRDVNLNMVGMKRPRSNNSVAPEIDTSQTALHTDQEPASKPKISFGLLPDFMQKDPLLVTKQRWLEKSNDLIPEEEEDLSERQKNEMMVMSVASLALAVGVVYALASSTPEMVEMDMEESKNVARDLLREGNVERLEIATRNIVGTVLPQSAEDVIAVSIGEGIAGAIGAFATWTLGMVLNFRGGEDGFVVTPVGKLGEGSDTKRLMGGGQSNVDALVSEAVADGDYFLTRAAAQPLLEAVGIPIFFASFASVLIATLPYEAVKLTSRKRQSAMEQEMLLNILLEEEENRKNDMTVVDKVSNNVFEFIQRLYVDKTLDEDVDDGFEEEEDEEDSVQQQLDSVPSLDYIELFADLTKWLEYDVLISNYRGVLALPNGHMIAAGWESAIFGLLAALSSQLYTDVLYLYSDFGNPLKRDRTINRSLEGWASIYATKCLSAATLFGVYEAVREPTARFVSQLVSGGVGGCRGSKDFDLCMETYLTDNPPSAEIDAQLRAFAVSTMNWADNLSSILLPLNDQETLDSFVRGAVVSLYSELFRIFSM